MSIPNVHLEAGASAEDTKAMGDCDNVLLEISDGPPAHARNVE